MLLGLVYALIMPEAGLWLYETGLQTALRFKPIFSKYTISNCRDPVQKTTKYVYTGHV